MVRGALSVCRLRIAFGIGMIAMVQVVRVGGSLDQAGGLHFAYLLPTEELAARCGFAVIADHLGGEYIHLSADQCDHRRVAKQHE